MSPIMVFVVVDVWDAAPVLVAASWRNAANTPACSLLRIDSISKPTTWTLQFQRHTIPAPCRVS
jgi:hypothetical protein